MTEATEPSPVRLSYDGAVGVIELNRPSKRNALDIATRAAIAEAFNTCARATAVQAVVITGGPSVFAAGADLTMLVDRGSQAVADLDLPQYWRAIQTFPKPIVAAVSGVAFGAGCELAMMCDVIVADRTARFGQPEISVGIMPGAGGTQRLVRALGPKVASLMLLAAEPIEAERAFQLGLVSDLVEPGQAQARALELATRISKMPPRGLAAIKRTLALGADLPLDAALAIENREFLLLFDTLDKTEGMRAFLERRKPSFTGA